jgi:tetratricopeptide (TPR) repeat protein
MVKNRRVSKALWLLAGLTFAGVVSAEVGEIACGTLANHFGPYDYRIASREVKSLVEGAHFTPKVESLRGGKNTITAGGDLNYTLRVFPNHPRALMAVIRLAEKEKRPKPYQMDYSALCWLDRAERFTPNDAMVQMIYGMYLVKQGKSSDGATKLGQALQLAGDNANVHYNLGLAYFDLKDYDKALASAHRAYELGFPLPGLRNKLEKAGKWREAPPKPAAPQ